MYTLIGLNTWRATVPDELFSWGWVPADWDTKLGLRVSL